ncbi:PREDICTED: ylmG homolog protein 2, chloroplastic [Prunus mume]|uniref:YlmG homolog protein 2, chloroplastic n=1 Tax=Prunus mume TaxID=102107 RepID=A0ABM1LIT8_PRUMU|nr:PREDICTED: ylmG homolog protein 2, chloroplastic [Prunus mume]
MAHSESVSATETPKPLASNFAPNCAMLLSSTNFAPFLRASPLKKPNLVLPDIPASIASATDKCLQLLHSLASQNPFLSKLLSLRSEFQSLCHQIRCRKHRQVEILSAHNFAAVLPGDSVAGLVVANGISNFLNLYNTLLVVRLVLTWFPNSPPAIVGPLSTICDPYLNIFRGLIPPLGGTLDLSPILAFLVLNAFTSTAAALPAELPASSQQVTASPAGITNLSTSQKKWMTRLQGNNTKSSGGVC